MEGVLGACARAKCRVERFKDVVTYFSALGEKICGNFKMLVAQLFYHLFEICKSLEPTSGHRELNGRCFGCVRARKMPRSARLRLGTKIFHSS